MSQGLWRVREAAKRNNKKTRFTALLHHVTASFLRDCFYALKRQAVFEFSKLNALPADASVYASTIASLRSPQNSRSGWFVTPFL